MSELWIISSFKFNHHDQNKEGQSNIFFDSKSQDIDVEGHLSRNLGGSIDHGGHRVNSKKRGAMVVSFINRHNKAYTASVEGAVGSKWVMTMLWGSGAFFAGPSQQDWVDHGWIQDRGKGRYLQNLQQALPCISPQWEVSGQSEPCRS